MHHHTCIVCIVPRAHPTHVVAARSQRAALARRPTVPCCAVLCLVPPPSGRRRLRGAESAIQKYTPADNSGIDSLRLYDPFTRKFTWTSKLGDGRWYPMLATLPNGEVGQRRREPLSGRGWTGTSLAAGGGAGSQYGAQGTRECAQFTVQACIIDGTACTTHLPACMVPAACLVHAPRSCTLPQRVHLGGSQRAYCMSVCACAVGPAPTHMHARHGCKQ